MTRTTDLAGKVIAITGGANGIGRETARHLAFAGARVAIGDRDAAAAESAAAELGAAVIAHELDVTDRDSFTRFVDAVEAELGPIDVLVNSAGVMWVGPFDEEPDSAAQRQISVNLLGIITSVKIVAPRLRSRGAGQIVTIASAASLLPTPGEATYAASKHGVLGYLKAVRTELRGSGVELSVIMPTVVETALAAGTGTGAATLLQPSDVAEAVVKVIQRPRFEVTLPGYVGIVYRLVNALPTLLRDAILGRMVPDQVQSVDREARSKYESQFGGGQGGAQGGDQGDGQGGDRKEPPAGK